MISIHTTTYRYIYMYIYIYIWNVVDIYMWYGMMYTYIQQQKPNKYT